jgi:outer membrane protein assembly factor BamA
MAIRVLIAALIGCISGGIVCAHAQPLPIGLELRGERIDRIDIQSKGAYERQKVLDAAGIKAGDRISLRAARDAVQRLFATGKYSDVIVRAHRERGQVVLVLELRPRLRLRDIRFTGNWAIPGDDLRKNFGFVPDVQEYTPATIGKLERSIEQSYEKRGYRSARADIQVVEDPGGEGVRLVADVQEGQPTRVAQIAFQGTPVFPRSELLRQLRLSEGEILDRERLQTSVDNLMRFYRGKGFYEVQIPAPKVILSAAGEAKAQVVFTIIAGPRLTVVFRGAQGFSRKALLSRLKLEDERRITDGTLAFLRERILSPLREWGFLNAKVDLKLVEEPKKKPPRKKVIITLHPGRHVIVRDVRFPGAEAVPASTLKEIVLSLVEERLSKSNLYSEIFPEDLQEEFGLGSPSEGTTAQGNWARPLPPRQVYLERAYKDAIQDMAQVYKNRGFTLVEIGSPRIVPVEKTDSVIVEYPVKEGVRSIIRKVMFQGNQAIPVADLQKEQLIFDGKPYNANLVEETRLRLHRLYLSRGYNYSRVEDKEEFSETRDVVNVTFNIREGPLVRVGTITIEGNVMTKAAVIWDVITARPGDLYTPERINDSQQNLFDLGLFTTVTVEPKDRDGDRRNERLYRDLRVRVRERKPGSFESGIGFSTGDGPRGFISASYANLFGYNLQALFVGKVNYQLFLFGDEKSREQRYSELQWHELIERQLTLSLNYPKILGVPFPLGARIDLSVQRRSQLVFGLDRHSVLLGLDVKIIPRRFSAQLQYEFENSTLVLAGSQQRFARDLQTLSSLTAAGCPSCTPLEKALIARLTQGTLNLGTIRPILTLDLRDNAFNPRSGFAATLTAEYTASITSGAILVNYIKLVGVTTGYIPLGSRTVLALQLSAGQIFHVSENSTTPAYKAFYLGGRGSIRGYPEESIIPEGRLITSSQASDLITQQLPPTSTGGDVFLFGRVELRFPMLGKLEGALFYDVGNLWLNYSTVDLTEKPRMSVGFGLRYPTPVGPLSIDYGVNLTRRYVVAEDPATGTLWSCRSGSPCAFYEGFGALHFSIGVF